MKMKKTFRWTYVHPDGKPGFLTFYSQEGCQLYLDDTGINAKIVKVILTPVPVTKTAKKRKKKTS